MTVLELFTSPFHLHLIVIREITIYCSWKVALHLFFFTPKRRNFLVWLSLAICFYSVGETKSSFSISEKLLAGVRAQYGQSAERRLVAWQKLIHSSSGLSEDEKLKKVNAFFNQIPFVSDAIHWNKNDYWATPVEFLVSNGGDCEDFSIAKYFTLKVVGISEQKLNMTYVKALSLNQAHMVVTYHSTPSAEPLVLDNIDITIKPATKRPDLLPVYSFNGSGLWLAKARGRGQRVGGSDRLKRWQELLNRMPEGL